ncbi:hypothetical protein PTSG_06264 [Salpingoeca rosetta]|uniref:Uncharacterized protein n=1 Tax=Salpingoeca rosetta (strain ATCC 50818 / BSB-021) TaxID=946362 RepID=F2UCE6_SALR5|nr:uncharacterized protein PTSG_06264 [Salpingoeca rosetta]EGD74253.1 hypothetical protein PTSG_06264 [Salpingoeca rosetta]|eukprot:XP_004993153.1 hypothetical protein PTSG_06264 [Salpingoeca rosetta]
MAARRLATVVAQGLVSRASHASRTGSMAAATAATGMPALAPTTTQILAQHSMSIWSKILKPSQEEEKKEKTQDAVAEPQDVQPAGEAFKGVETKAVPESVDVFVKERLASLRSSAGSSISDKTRLSSLREKYLLLAECEEAFNQHVDMNMVSKLDTVQHVVKYFEKKLNAEPREFGWRLRRAEPLPQNVVVSDPDIAHTQ